MVMKVQLALRESTIRFSIINVVLFVKNVQYIQLEN